MWLSVWWQLAQIAAETSWKLTRPPPFVGLAMLLNGHTPSYGAAPPTSVGVADSSTGKRAQSKVSCTKRPRRIARFEKNCFIRPGSVSTPALGPPLVHSAGVKTPVPGVNVGQLPDALGNRFMLLCWGGGRWGA